MHTTDLMLGRIAADLLRWLRPVTGTRDTRPLHRTFVSWDCPYFSRPAGRELTGGMWRVALG
jgi:hypothetical protein